MDRRLLLALLAGGISACVVLGLTVATATTRLSPAQAVALAHQPKKLGAIGAIRLRSVEVRPAGAWHLSQLDPETPVWRVIFAGEFYKRPSGRWSACPEERPTPQLMPSFCPRALRASVYLSDTTGAWVGERHSDFVSPFPPAPQVVKHPRTGQSFDLPLGSQLILGTPPPSGFRWSGWSSSNPAVVRTLRSSKQGEVVQSEAVGSAILSQVGSPKCAPGQACPQIVTVVRVKVRVLPPMVYLSPGSGAGASTVNS